MTETDLITAGGNSDNDQLPSPVNSDISTPAAEEASNSTPTAETAPTASQEKDVASGNRAGSLSTMVLPELRALAKQIGVEGDELVIGALTTYTELRRSPVVAEFVPALAEAAATIGAGQATSTWTRTSGALPTPSRGVQDRPEAVRSALVRLGFRPWKASRLARWTIIGPAY